MTTRSRSRTYAQQMGRFSQLPRELQIEAWLRMDWEDRELVCTTRNAPSFCTSEDSWKEAMKGYKRDKSYDDDLLITSMLTPIIDKIFKETSGQGSKKYFSLETSDPDDDRIYVKASDKREGLWKASEEYYKNHDKSLYHNAIIFYIWDHQYKGDDFSFDELSKYVFKYMTDGSHGDDDYQIYRITMIE